MENQASEQKDEWASGTAYEPYVGRWSRLVASEFLNWLAVPRGSRWLDVGCGTGALSRTILQAAKPSHVKGIDQSEGYIAFVRAHIQDRRVRFEAGDALRFQDEAGSYDAVVTGLVLNFLPDPEQAVAEMSRAARSGGVVAGYVWDYAGKMQFMRHFWNAAGSLEPEAKDLDEGRRFPLCQPEPLGQLFGGAGLNGVEVRAIDIWTEFQDFDDYWLPFLGGQGPAPGYTVSLSEERRVELRERIRMGLPFSLDGSIPLVARAWAVRGTKP